MKKVYNYKKEIIFKTNIYDILSIALDKKFSIEDQSLKGVFQINGEYLADDKTREEFNYQLSYLNYIDDNYDISKIKVDIDDFYYEIKDSSILVINIDIVVDGIEEKERCIDTTDEMFIQKEEIKEEKSNNDSYVSYKVCIVGSDDTIESIIEKYDTTLDNIKKYNVINDIKPGDKIIIPYERS